ncbi:YggS family pyridoxal phosphate-dependent enzyme [Pleomorphomonas sp. NRK KF1]|uniref:YggS family pyridoxal phosphate-dependent enzyme n=1 Tax=Pleomorphomonas sp. NRK KF1 TaxID=2943000 RepID=UPI002043BD55|nr:YggS family pyridoxal phosphate-dependent enzyme [Pleomorphomonas sp. NRK KF1]MCM5554744.1 YggS family pyridoxal phosphate-dependent enzyme [Pleomorphomonas sp. NRK KF1]
MTISEALGRVRAVIEGAEEEAGRPTGSVTLIAVSKTFPEADVRAAIAAGQLVFGENRVQEAAAKFPSVKADFPAVELHLIGPLQSNKTREAVALFDVIHSVDRDKIAAALAKEMQAQKRFPKLLVQVNTGEEPQKAGIAPRETVDFVKRCRDVHGLAIAGLMCIPPVGDPPAPHFALLDELARRAGVAFRSMGMSADYETAIGQGATHVRVGSAIFGYRTYGAD